MSDLAPTEEEAAAETTDPDAQAPDAEAVPEAVEVTGDVIKTITEQHPFFKIH